MLGYTPQGVGLSQLRDKCADEMPRPTTKVILIHQNPTTVTMFDKIGFFKRGGMGPLLVLVFPCFRETVVVTCKIGSFLCSLDNLLQKNVIVFFFKIKFQKGAHLKKRAFLTYFSHFLVTRGKLQKFLQHIFHSHTYMYFAHPIELFALTNFEKKIRIYQVWFLFSMIPGVDSYSRHFGTINKYQTGEQNLSWNVFY